MRQPDKVDLLNGLIKKVPVCVTEEKPIGVMYVIDGEAVLQHLPLPKSASFTDLCNSYVKYMHNHFDNALIVFDRYGSGPSTKNESHQRRIGSDLGEKVNVALNMMLTMKKAFSDKFKVQAVAYQSSRICDGEGKGYSSATLTW